MDDVFSLKFGIFNDFTIPFRVGSINSVFPVNSRECICSTSRNLYKIEKNEIKMTFHQTTFSASLLIPDTDILVGVATRTNRLFVYQTTNLSQPIISNYPTNHLGVFHIYYSPRSSSLILIGYGIKVYYLKLDYQGNCHSVFPPDVTIKFRSKFCDDFSPVLLAPVPFDPEHEYIYLPTKEGICPFDLDGNKKEPMSKFPASSATVYFYNEYSRKIFTFEANSGLIKWTQSGQIEQRFPSAGTSIVSMFLVDEENIVCYNSMKQIFLLNFITGRTFFCYNLDKKPSRLFLIKLFNKPYLIVCEGATLVALKIEIPWNVWSHPLLNCNYMVRCNQMNEAARIFVQSKDNIIDLYSPSKGKLISSATQKKAVNPISFFYDRGFIQYAKKNYSKYELFNIKIDPIENSQKVDVDDSQKVDSKVSQKVRFDYSKLKESHRDILYFVFDDGSISGFFTGVSPCEEIINLNLKASFLCTVLYEKVWCYAAVSKKGILSLYDYVTFSLITQTNIGYLDVITFFYDVKNQSLIIVNTKNTLIYDLEKKQIKNEIEITGTNVVTFFGDFLKFGYKNGHITTIYIENSTFNTHSIIDKHSHSAEVTGFSFSQEFWISSSLDCHLIAWNYNEEKLFQILLPIPLTSCCIINGYRDILVSTETEIMKIEGKKLFLKIDDEIPEIDNYDKICDYLELPHYFVIEQMMRKAKSKLASTNKSNQTKTNKNIKNEVKSEIRSNSSSSLKTNKNSKSENINENFKSPPKTRNVQDNEKILQSMMELNGLKSPIIPKIKIIEQQQQQNQKKNSNENSENDKNEDKKNSINKNENESKQTISIKPISAKDFLKSEIEKEKKISSKPKKIKKKKNNLKNKNENKKDDSNESKPIKNAIDLLNQLDQSNRNKKDIQQTNNKIKKKESSIDISALAKQFEKVNDDKDNLNNKKEYEYEYESESESESESENEKKSKKKNSKHKKDKNKKIEFNSEKNKTNPSIKIKNENKIDTKPIRNKSKPELIKKKNCQNLNQKDKIKSKSNSNSLLKINEISKENQLLQSRGIQGDSLKNNINRNNEYDLESNEEIENNSNSDDKIYQTNNEDETENNENDLETEEEEEISENIEHKTDDEEEINETFATKTNGEEVETNEIISHKSEEEEEEENNENSKQISDENEYNESNEDDEFFVTNQNQNQIENELSNVIESNQEANETTIQKQSEMHTESDSNSLKEEKIHPISHKPQEFKETDSPSPRKPFNSNNKNIETSYSPPNKFSFKLKKSKPISDQRVRASTPDPTNRPNMNSKYSVQFNKSIIHRSFSCRPKRQTERVYDFDLSNIDQVPANIWIDENFLYEKYSIRLFQKEKNFIQLPADDFMVSHDNSERNSNKTKSVKLPSKPKSNFFRRNYTNNENFNEDDNEKLIDKTVNRLSLNQFQLHQFQRDFEYNMKYEINYENTRLKNRSNNNDNFRFKSDVSKNFERNELLNSKIQYNSKNQKSKNSKEKTTGSTVKVYKVNQNKNTSKNDDNIRLKNKENKNNDNNEDDELIPLNNAFINSNFNDENETEIMIVPSIQKVSRSPRKIKKSERKSGAFYIENFVVQKTVINKDVDKLEQAFMKKVPNFELKNKRPNSSRKISKPQPKLYLNPVYPPNRNRGVDGTVVHSSFSNNNFNYY